MLLDVTLKITPALSADAQGNEKIARVGHLGTHFDVMDKEFPPEYTQRPGIVFDVRGCEEEILQAQEEGIQVHPAHTFEAIVGTDRAEGVRLCRVKSFTFDENRRAIIEKEENSEYTIAGDTVIFATGQRTDITPDAGLELGRGNSIAVQLGSLRTSVEGIYACGDAVYGTRTVIQAIAAGREAASEIDRALGGDGDISEQLAPVERPDARIGKVEGFADLPRAEEQFVGAEDRYSNFAPISAGLCDSAVCGEVARCLQSDLRFQITSHRIWNDYIQEEKEGAQGACCRITPRPWAA